MLSPVWLRNINTEATSYGINILLLTHFICLFIYLFVKSWAGFIEASPRFIILTFWITFSQFLFGISIFYKHVSDIIIFRLIQNVGSVEPSMIMSLGGSSILVALKITLIRFQVLPCTFIPQGDRMFQEAIGQSREFTPLHIFIVTGLL